MKKRPFWAYAGPIGILAIALVVLITGFVIPQDCDLDKIYLWCRVHPTKPIDQLGISLVLVGAIYQAVLWFFYHDEIIWEKALNWLGLGGIILGTILMWI